MGWVEESVHVPPDNRVSVVWMYYGPLSAVSPIAVVSEYEARRFALRVVGPRPGTATSRDLRNTIIEVAKREAELLLLNLGWTDIGLEPSKLDDGTGRAANAPQAEDGK